MIVSWGKFPWCPHMSVHMSAHTQGKLFNNIHNHIFHTSWTFPLGNKLDLSTFPRELILTELRSWLNRENFVGSPVFIVIQTRQSSQEGDSCIMKIESWFRRIHFVTTRGFFDSKFFCKKNNFERNFESEHYYTQQKFRKFFISKFSKLSLTYWCKIMGKKIEK